MKQEKFKAAIDRAYEFCEQKQAALDKGDITEAQWFENHNAYFTNAYLKSDNPCAQSGHGGDETRYRYTQGMILEALYKNGSFIDIGCANGYLIEKLDQWIQNIDIQIEFRGLDISKELLKIAKQRLPQQWKNNLFPGNALYWQPPKRFDYVCVKELNYVPRDKRQAFFIHLYNDLVSDNGRLILGPITEELNQPGIRYSIEEWGFSPSGYCLKSHQEHKELIRRLYWFDK